MVNPSDYPGCEYYVRLLLATIEQHGANDRIVIDKAVFDQMDFGDFLDVYFDYHTEQLVLKKQAR